MTRVHSDRTTRRAMIGGSQKVATKGRSKVMMSNAEARAARLTSFANQRSITSIRRRSSTSPAAASASASATTNLQSFTTREPGRAAVQDEALTCV